ncbi:MAG: hypothetical protein KDK78_07910 [Chlamydiia bacterium]|nr:hypothetical protein [Chlamydiia bacterium]
MRIPTIATCLALHITACWSGVVYEPLDTLPRYGAALNIEGGRIPQQLLCPDQQWGNICFVLDQPFQTGIEHKDLTAKSRFALKEANILEFNERRAALASALIIKYYVTYAHQIFDLAANESARIVVQAHRNSTGPAHVRQLRSLLDLIGYDCSDLPNGNCYFAEQQVEVDLRYGVEPQTYEGVHLVLSISAVAGLHPDWESGSLLLAHTFTPFDLSTATISTDLKYEVRNCILEDLEGILQLQDEALIQSIREGYSSSNEAKAGEQVERLDSSDFHPAEQLQVNGLFNPSWLPENLAVVD